MGQDIFLIVEINCIMSVSYFIPWKYTLVKFLSILQSYSISLAYI